MSGPVMVMAGGTGGHIFPGLAVADVLRERQVPVVWLGSKRGLENQLVPAHGIALETLSITGLRGKGKLALLLAPFRLARAVWQAATIMRAHRPRSVLSMGGFAAAPGGIAAWLLRYPLVVHEQNQIAGLTNRLLSRFAKRVLGGFPEALKGLVRVGNPVRESIAQLPSPAVRLRDRGGPIRLLVLGGSQGARAINEVLPQALNLMDPVERPQLWHQLGKADYDAGSQRYRQQGLHEKLNLKLAPFIDDMASAYAWADLVLCRSGALTIAELAAAGVASVLVPYPHAVDDHQTANGRYLVEAGAALMIAEAELTAEQLATVLTDLGRDRERLRAMAEKARETARVSAAADVADVCLEVSCG